MSLEQKLGRRYVRDTRDDRYPVRSLIATPRATDRTFRFWYTNARRDQIGSTCVANTCHDLLAASPNPIRPDTLEWSWGRTPRTDDAMVATTPYHSAQSGERGFRGNLYDQAQLADEWPETPPEDGTSIRAAMKTLQAWGLVENYYWATSVDEVAQAILTIGPVAWGSAWYSNQFGTQRGDRVYLEPTGRIVGGHAIALTGTNLKDEVFRVSTWGATYWLTYDAAAFLLDLGDAEAAVYTEVGA